MAIKPPEIVEDTTELEQIPASPEGPDTPGPDEAAGTRTEPPLPEVRIGVALGFSVMAAAVMVGGVFVGIVGPRFWAGVAGALGIIAAIRIRRIQNPLLMNLAITGSIFGIGILIAAPGGSFGDVVNLGPFMREAVTSGDVLRPPVEFTLGWRPILGWTMAGVGLAAAWTAIELRRPALGLLLPLPLVAIGAISTPDDAKIVSGLVSVVLFAFGMGLLSGVNTEGDGEQRSLAFEMRRAARALPLIAVITVVLYLLAQTGLLFPPPRYDPTQSAQRPKTVPLTEVEDRVLFTVRSRVTGPWRMGSLDVYDGTEWRLPPFAESNLEEVPRDGVVDEELSPGVRAEFEIRGLDGAVFPGLPNLVGIVAEGPALAYDERTGNIRLAQGSVQPGLRYTVVAARIPSVQDLERVTQPIPRTISGVRSESFLDIPPPPPAVQALIDRAPKDSKWAELDFLREELLQSVVSVGSGLPVEVPPERVADMLTGSQEGSPFEIVAAQAMLARWIGIPSRIGYGYDGGEEGEDEGTLEIRPLHGASFVEVYFPGHKWLPIIGTPQQAQASFAELTQQDESLSPGTDIGIQIFVPYETDPRSLLFEQVRQILLILVPLLLLAALTYATYPAVVKAVRRNRRRARAQDQGIRERIAVAYADWRDLATDFGYGHHSDTPLMFLDRVAPDQDHVELAWLVTRTLWGDLKRDLRIEDAMAAEELSRSLRKRLSQAHTAALRAVAAVSRLSIREPYPTQERHFGVTMEQTEQKETTEDVV